MQVGALTAHVLWCTGDTAPGTRHPGPQRPAEAGHDLPMEFSAPIQRPLRLQSWRVLGCKGRFVRTGVRRGRMVLPSRSLGRGLDLGVEYVRTGSTWLSRCAWSFVVSDAS